MIPITANMADSVYEDKTLHFNGAAADDPISNMAANYLETA